MISDKNKLHAAYTAIAHLRACVKDIKFRLREAERDRDYWRTVALSLLDEAVDTPIPYTLADPPPDPGTVEDQADLLEVTRS